MSDVEGISELLPGGWRARRRDLDKTFRVSLEGGAYAEVQHHGGQEWWVYVYDAEGEVLASHQHYHRPTREYIRWAYSEAPTPEPLEGARRQTDASGEHEPPTPAPEHCEGERPNPEVGEPRGLSAHPQDARRRGMKRLAQRWRGSSAAEFARLMEGGYQLGRKAFAEGQLKDANPFAAECAKRSLVKGNRDKFEAASRGWQSGWVAASEGR